MIKRMGVTVDWENFDNLDEAQEFMDRPSWEQEQLSKERACQQTSQP